MRDLYAKAAALTVPLVGNITDEQLAGPTPCAEFDVRALLNHLYEVVVAFQRTARFEPMDFDDSREHITGDDWRQRFATEVAAVSREWSRPEALEGEGSVPGFPRELLARLPVFDLTVHGWDLARATGQEFRADPALVEAVYEIALGFAETARQAGQVGEPVAVPETAPVIDRLVGLVGRDPAWKP